MNREKAIIFLKQIIEKVSNSSTESFKSIDFYNVNSCTNDLECEDDGMNFLSTMLLKLNSQGYFLSAYCSYCKILPTTSRSCFKISNRKYKLVRKRTCEISFFTLHIPA